MTHRSLTANRLSTGMSRQQWVIALSTSLISPISLLIAAWSTQSSRQKHWLLTLFFGFFGATIAVFYDPLGRGGDGVRHLLHVHQHYVGMGLTQFWDELGSILLLRGQTLSDDVFKHATGFIAGGVFGAPWLFFVLVAFVYGYFMSGSMLIVFREWGGRRLPLAIVVLGLVFFLAYNLQGVQAVRTHTGLWVLVYGTLRYFETRQLRHLAIILSSPLYHFGYALMMLPILVVVVLGNRKILFVVLFAASSLTTFVNPAVVTDTLSATRVGEHRSEVYLSEQQQTTDMTLQRIGGREDRFWNAYVRSGVLKWVLNILVLSIVFSGLYFSIFSRFQQYIFSSGLLVLTASNSFWFLTELSGRSWRVGLVLVLAAFLMARFNPVISRRFPMANPIYRYGVFLSAMGFLPFIFWCLSNMLDFISPYLFALPFIPVLDPALNLSLKVAVRNLVDLLLGR